MSIFVNGIVACNHLGDLGSTVYQSKMSRVASLLPPKYLLGGHLSGHHFESRYLNSIDVFDYPSWDNDISA